MTSREEQLEYLKNTIHDTDMWGEKLVTLELCQDVVNEIYNGVDELKAELKAKDEENAKLKERIAELESQCVNCECAKFADNAIKPSMALGIYNALKNSVKKD